MDETLQFIYPLPKASPRKNIGRGWKPGKATILTDDAKIEIIALEKVTNASTKKENANKIKKH